MASGSRQSLPGLGRPFLPGHSPISFAQPSIGEAVPCLNPTCLPALAVTTEPRQERKGRHLSPPADAADWDYVLGDLEAFTVSCIRATRTRCSPAPTTASIAAPIAAPPSSAPIFRTRECRSGRSWRTRPTRNGCSPAARRSRLSQRRRRRELEAHAQPGAAAARQDAVRLPRDAVRAQSPPPQRDLCGAGGQRRDALDRRRRDLERLQRGPASPRRAGAAAALEAGQRYRGRRHARRPRDLHQRRRSGQRHHRGAHGPVPQPRQGRDLGGHAGGSVLAVHLRPRHQVSPQEPSTLYTPA